MKKKALSNLGLDITKLILYFLCFHFNLKGLKEYAMFFFSSFSFSSVARRGRVNKGKKKEKKVFLTVKFYANEVNSKFLI
jgi:hypothetical protein